MSSYYRKEIRTDFVGTYTAYIYADGHVETVPANRPQSREDVQQNRLREFASTGAKRALQAQRSAQTTGNPKASIVRENRLVMGPRVLNENLAATLTAISTMAATFQSPASMRDQLIREADLGGVVVGDRAGDRPEYAASVPFSNKDPRRQQREIEYDMGG